MRSLATDCCGWPASAHPANRKAPVVRTNAANPRIITVILVSMRMYGTSWSIKLRTIEIEHDVVYSIMVEVKKMLFASLLMARGLSPTDLLR